MTSFLLLPVLLFSDCSLTEFFVTTLFCFVKLIKLFKVVVGDSALGLTLGVVDCIIVGGGGGTEGAGTAGGGTLGGATVGIV